MDNDWIEIYIYDPETDYVLDVKEWKEEVFIQKVLDYPLVDYWLGNAEDEEGNKVFDEDYDWTCSRALVEDIRNWACAETHIDFYYKGEDL